MLSVLCGSQTEETPTRRTAVSPSRSNEQIERNNLRRIQILKGGNLLGEILSVRKFPEGESTKGHVVPRLGNFQRTEKCTTALLLCITAVVY